MKIKLTLIALALLFSSCLEHEYNSVAWESRIQDKKIEILKKQIMIDSLERVRKGHKDTFCMHIDTIRMPYIMRDTVYINDTIVKVEIQRKTIF